MRILWFLYILRRIQRVFLFLLRHLMFFNNKYHKFHELVRLVSFVVFSLSPIQELEPGATPFRGGRSAAAILADRSSLKQKKYFDYDY